MKRGEIIKNTPFEIFFIICDHMKKMVCTYATVVYAIWYVILIVIPFLPSIFIEDKYEAKITTYMFIFCSIMLAFIFGLNIYLAAVKAPYIVEISENGVEERFLGKKKLSFSWDEIGYIFLLNEPQKYICFAKRKVNLTQKRRLYILATAYDFILFPRSPEVEQYVRKHTDVPIHDETHWTYDPSVK